MTCGKSSTLCAGSQVCDRDCSDGGTVAVFAQRPAAVGGRLFVYASVNKQAQRWIKADCFNDIVNDLRALIRAAVGEKAPPTTAIYDGQTLQGTV